MIQIEKRISPKKNTLWWIAVFLSLAVVGCIDYLTGIEIRIYPLYWLPLALAANRFQRTGAIVASLIATLFWTASNYFGGTVFSHAYIWLINSITQFIGFMLVVFLVSSLRKSITREQYLSQVDGLTGLLNRRTFQEQAASVLSLCHRNRRPVTLAFIDLDNFKQVNDSAGHQQGDELLKHVARIINQSHRSSDLVARLGGDEFAVFLPEADETQARFVLEKMHRKFHQTVEISALNVGASIGAVVYHEAPVSLSEMLDRADALMYQVKKTGKNGVNIQASTEMTTPCR